MKMSGCRAGLVAVLLLTALPARAREWAFGIVPQQSVEKLTAAWSPLLAEVERRSGVRLRLETAPSVVEFDRHYLGEDYDFAFVNPYVYAVLDAPPRHRALAREAGLLRGVILVRRDSALRALRDLKGARVAFPGPYSYGSTILNKRALQRAGLNPESDVLCEYAGGQEQAYRMLLLGRADAAGGIRKTYDLLSLEDKAQLLVLHETDPAMPLPITANRRVPPAEARKVTAALTELALTPQGRLLLKKAGLSGIVPAVDSDWDELRKLDKENAP